LQFFKLGNERVVARIGRLPALFQAPQRGTGGQCRIAGGSQQPQRRVMAQLIVIVQILIAQSQSKHPLGQQIRQPVAHTLLSPMIFKTTRHTSPQIKPAFTLTQQQNASIRGDLTAIESGGDLARSEGGEEHGRPSYLIEKHVYYKQNPDRFLEEKASHPLFFLVSFIETTQTGKAHARQ